MPKNYVPVYMTQFFINMLFIIYIMQEMYTSLQLTSVGNRNLGSEAQLQRVSHTPAVGPGLGPSGTL
jgi:hypothetical protein